MLNNSYFIVALFSILVVLSYLFSYISERTKIPSVLLLLATGIGSRLVFNALGVVLPGLQLVLEVFGIIGLILIVLEGTLELKLSKDRLGLIFSAFFAALIILLISSASIAGVIQLFTSGNSYRVCFINALPLAVISSAIAIPSVAGFAGQKKEFIVYESIFSDILGILIFNMMLNNETVDKGTVGWFFADLSIVSVVSIGATLVMLKFMEKVKSKARFFLLIAVLILLYDFGKMFHLSALLLVLIFGLFLNNLDIFGKQRMQKYFHIDSINLGLGQFKLIIDESAFLIRTFFFFIFGFSLQMTILGDLSIWFTGIIIVFILYMIRFLYMKFFTKMNTIAEILVAPRGLITILLFYSIPQNYSIGIVSEGLLFFVILSTSIMMMVGIMGHKDNKEPDMEVFFGRDKVEL